MMNSDRERPSLGLIACSFLAFAAAAVFNDIAAPMLMAGTCIIALEAFARSQLKKSVKAVAVRSRRK